MRHSLWKKIVVIEFGPIRCHPLNPRRAYEEAVPEVNAPILLWPQGMTSELLEDEPGEDADEERVEAQIAVEVAPNARPFQPQETGYHRMLEQMTVGSIK